MDRTKATFDSSFPEFVWDMTPSDTLRYLATTPNIPPMWFDYLHRLAQALSHHEPPVVL